LNKWKDVQTETEDKREELKIKIEDLKEELFCNRSITFKEGNAKIDSKELFGEIVVEDTNVPKIDTETLELFEESKKISDLYYLESYSGCDTIEDSGYESVLRKYMINLLGFSAKLADRLINNSLAENLPTGLKTKEQREQQKNQLMKLKGASYSYGGSPMIFLESKNPDAPKDLMVPVGYILYFYDALFDGC